MIRDAFERVLFTARFLLAPLYLALAISLVALLVKGGMHLYELLMQLQTLNDEQVLLSELAIVDLTLTASIVAISAIKLLEAFMNIDHESDRELYWLVGIHLTFVVSTIVLALAERFGPHTHPSNADSEDA
jgi:uncharacterized membrane protein YqhA